MTHALTLRDEVLEQARLEERLVQVAVPCRFGRERSFIEHGPWTTPLAARAASFLPPSTLPGGYHSSSLAGEKGPWGRGRSVSLTMRGKQDCMKVWIVRLCIRYLLMSCIVTCVYGGKYAHGGRIRSS